MIRCFYDFTKTNQDYHYYSRRSSLWDKNGSTEQTEDYESDYSGKVDAIYEAKASK